MESHITFIDPTNKRLIAIQVIVEISNTNEIKNLIKNLEDLLLLNEESEKVSELKNQYSNTNNHEKHI
jgi:hypothetical protein